MRAGKFDPCQKSDEGKRTDEIVSEKIGIGSRDTYRKEKFIVDNQASLSPEEFADWDEGKLSTNKAFMKIKDEKKILEERLRKLELANQNLQNYEKLTEMIPELEVLVDTRIVTKDAALALINNLSEKELAEFIESIPTDKKYSQAQMDGLPSSDF